MSACPLHQDEAAIWRAAEAIYRSAKAGDGYLNQARAALAAAASGGDVKQAPGEAPQSGHDSGNAQTPPHSRRDR